LTSTVFIPGVWDLLHVGHMKFIERASRFGTLTIIGVESDELVKKEKSKFPVIPLKDRISALESLRRVDVVVPFYDFDYVSCIERYKVNVFALSELNRNSTEDRFRNVEDYSQSHDLKIIYLPYTKDISSTMIKAKVLDYENPWKPVWERIGMSGLDDVAVVSSGLTEKSSESLSKYITKILNIKDYDTVLDFGCGSGIMLKNISCKRFGIDISEGMIGRAVKNCPAGVFLVDSHITFKNRFDFIISYGVMHYLPSLEYAEAIIKEMLSLSKNILIMEVPDIEKRELREKYRKSKGLSSFPEHLYFDRRFFQKFGFGTFDNEISLTNNSDYGFTAIMYGH